MKLASTVLTGLLFSSMVNHALADGSLSNYLRDLKLGRMLKYEYVPEFQSALYAPNPLATLVGNR